MAERFPLLDRALDELVGATFSPRDGLVNPNAVRAWFRREAEQRGVRFLNRHYVTGVETRRVAGAGGSLRRISALHVVEVAAPGRARGRRARARDPRQPPRSGRPISAAKSRIACDVVVNCLGAWSPIFSAKVGVTDVTEPVRRQICLVDVHASDLAPGVDLDALGMIVDASDLYFHPEGSHVLAGYSIPDEGSGFDFDYDGESFFETYVWPRLAHRIEQLRALRPRARLVGPLRGDARSQRDRRRGARLRELLRGPRIHGARRDAVLRGRAARWRSGSTRGASARSTCRRSTARASRIPSAG